MRFTIHALLPVDNVPMNYQKSIIQKHGGRYQRQVVKTRRLAGFPACFIFDDGGKLSKAEKEIKALAKAIANPVGFSWYSVPTEG